MFWCRTHRMPCRHSRSGTGFGPGDRSGHGGSTGSIRAQQRLQLTGLSKQLLRAGAEAEVA